MALRIRHIAHRFALLLALAAVVPLVAYGVISIWSLRRGTRASITTGNENVATRAAEEIRRYVVGNAGLLKALAADLQNTGLEAWQQDRILKNYVLEFREFREITLFDEGGAIIAWGRVGKPRVTIPKDAELSVDGVLMSPMRVDEDLLPTSAFGIHLTRLNRPAGWLAGELNLEEMWRMVDRIRLGEHGYAMVIAPDGALIAHGDPDKKALGAQTRNMSSSNPMLAATREQREDAPVAREYVNEDGRRDLGVAAKIPALGWTVVVEQPTNEAFASAQELQKQLIVAISLALFAMIAVGYAFGRSFIDPILELKRATHDVAARGHLDTRVDITTGDEFADLGESFNVMADRLVETQYASGPLFIEGDRFALGRVYRNLITNAIQATEAGGRIIIGTARAGDHVEITVADTGSGIPADRLSKIFDDFVTTKRRGLGLGLAISKRIVEQLDGTIAVESEVGRGTAFTLRFPARDDRPAQAAAS